MNRPQGLFAVLACTLATGVAAETRNVIIDWSVWDAILRAHVISGQVDYEAIRRDPRFDGIVSDIANADVAGHDSPTVLAFYINTYNVLAVKGILDGQSPKSTLGKLKFFYRSKHDVAGERLTLNQIEHKKIRPWGEPRIHFAIVCASASCPPLRSEAYLPRQLERQLDDNARIFINDATKNRFDKAGGKAYISMIFKWFAEDFVEKAGGVQTYLADFVDDPRVAETLRKGKFKIKYMKYDWTLNGTIGSF